MTELEEKIIKLVNDNKYLSNELKKRYILTLFLMETGKQEEYLILMKEFEKRCDEMKRGIFMIGPSEMHTMMRTYDDVKKDILKKLDNNKQK